jgi:hypothetical protein
LDQRRRRRHGRTRRSCAVWGSPGSGDERMGQGGPVGFSGGQVGWVGPCDVG